MWIEHREPCQAAADLAKLHLGHCRKENPTLYRTNPYRGKVHPYGRAASFAKDTKTGARVPVFSNGKAEPRAARTGARALAFLNGRAGQRAGLAVCLSNS